MTRADETKLPGNFVSSGAERKLGVTKLRGSFVTPVTLHVLDTAGLQGREEAYRSLVAPHFIIESKSETFRLEKLGAGLLLCLVLGVARDDQLRIGEHGKLFLAGHGPAFNISDDNGLVVLGVLEPSEEPERDAKQKRDAKSEPDTKVNGLASGKPRSNQEIEPQSEARPETDSESIGVDVNEVPDVLDRPKLSVARRYFSPTEMQAVGTGEKYEERVAFARAWGGIEAPLKAMGTGFTFDFTRHREALDAWQITSAEIEVASQDATAAPRHFVAVVAASRKPQVTVVMHDAQEF